MPFIPNPTVIEPVVPGTGDSVNTVQSNAMNILQAKYADAYAWAEYAAELLKNNVADTISSLGSDTVNADILALTTEIGVIADSHPGTITGGTGTFSDQLLTDLKSRLIADIASYSTGLGATVESAMFARETARVAAENLKAYTSITTDFSSRNFDMPTGGLLAKQTEVNNENNKRATESSGKILEESARLALDYNKATRDTSVQLLDLLAKVFESKEARTFEASKATVMLAAEAYKNTLGLAEVKANLILKKGDLALTAKARQLNLEVTTLSGLSQAYIQMIAASLNGVSVSSSFGFSGGESASTNRNVSKGDVSRSASVSYDSSLKEPTWKDNPSTTV